MTLWKFTLRSIRAGLISRETARNASLAILANRDAAPARKGCDLIEPSHEEGSIEFSN